MVDILLGDCGHCKLNWAECTCGRNEFEHRKFVARQPEVAPVDQAMRELGEELVKTFEFFEERITDPELCDAKLPAWLDEPMSFNDAIEAIKYLRARVEKEQRITDPVTGGQKGSKPERFDLLPWDALEEVARLYGRGADKYEDRNWEKGYGFHLSMAALMRHLVKFWQHRKDYDDETKCHHLASVVFHALTMLTFVLRGIGTDDRPD